MSRIFASPALCLILLSSAGCGGSFADRAGSIHEVLNTITDTVDPSYELAVQVCSSRADAILARTDSGEETDRADLTALRERCAAAAVGFESVREAQIAVRAAIAVAQAENTQAAFLVVLAKLADLRSGWETIRAALRDAGIIRSGAGS